MIGDLRLGSTIDVKFCTRNAGVPTTLAGTPVISAYVDNGTTELTAGITLSVDFDGRTGYHNVRVVASSANGYTTASNVSLAITTGTVGGVSVVGVEIESFSIEARSALMPTTAARTLDVTAANKVNGVVLVDTVTTYTGDTPQTGDAYARLGAAGAGLTAIGDTRIANLDATISSRTKPADTQARVTLVDTTTTLTNAPSDSSGTTTLLTRLSALRAGYLENLSAGAAALESSLQTLITTVGAAGAGLTATATAVWAVATRLLTAGTNIVLAKGVGLTGLNDLSAAQVNTEADTAITDAALATAANLATADAVVDAIKLQTDKLTFDADNALDANLQKVNDVTLIGDGDAIPWGPV